ncbi:hypothetical protein CPB84DRAFT_1849286 [Gymnopilus junonius]|uniref:Uncharacterized protein n=1 Tax=Gymnopilus junonius TaxID=109634 RepID=A0A9P5NKX6_GYMJU|nr:hypothetical protein CPB84DRAFT_1849286 [Gymnopilus junonius]
MMSPQQLAVFILAHVFYLLATSFLISAPFFWIPYYIYAMMDVDELENTGMDVDCPNLEKGVPCEQGLNQLPFLKLNADGTIETQYLDIGVNMANLTMQLEDFSRKEDLWDHLRSGACCAHLGC